MSPEDFARRHPRLFHVTAPDALASILRHGLLPTSHLLSLFEVPDAARAALVRQRRALRVRLCHPLHGAAEITDNGPLSEVALARCLDDHLTPADWLQMLNARVFFWCDALAPRRFLGARLNRGRARLVLEFDALSLLHATAERAELAAINTGSTIRRPARRGLATFSPLGRHSYHEWRRLRGGLDRPKEVTVRGGVLDVGRHLIRATLASQGSEQGSELDLCRGRDLV